MDKKYYIKIINNIPKTSGIYIFCDKTRRPLYIGKARNLANRVGSYFHGSKVPMITAMLNKAQSITWQETPSEIEALILESVLIKKYRPRFNTLLRDDKQYFYVAISSDKFPRISITHQPQSVTNYVGPFTDGGALKSALKMLRKIFPYCTCKQKHLNYCLNFHIGNCRGFCCLKNPSLFKAQLDGYRENIRNIQDTLNGKKRSVVKKIITRLQKEHDFESYGKISQLQKFFLNTQVIKNSYVRNKLLLDLRKHLLLIHTPVRIEGYDISNISGLFATGAMVVFTNGRPDKNEYRKFKIKSLASSGDTGMLREVIERRFSHSEWQSPDLILVDGGKGQVNIVTKVLKQKSLDIPVIGLVKNERHQGEKVWLGHVNKMIDLNALPNGTKHLLLQIDSEAHRFAIQYYRKRHSFKR